ncbi:MAG: hypothetical protein MZV70_54760 [Desulfobacterales bacterium]|nr:hypothetical protein [Desulfobacterales bacterium]
MPDLLATNAHLQAATNHYGRAAQLFFREGQFLQGIATKWVSGKRLSPQKEEIEAFLSGCQKHDS